MNQPTQEQITRVADTTALGAAFATFFKLLPDITALFALLYLLIRISETDRFRQFWRFLFRRK